MAKTSSADAPTPVQELLRAVQDLGGEIVVPSDTDWPWEIEVSGWMTPGEFYADLDENGQTFSLVNRSWSLNGGLSREREIATALTPVEAAVLLREIVAKEKADHDKLEALMAAADEASEREARGEL